jgi:hypothetical protein
LEEFMMNERYLGHRVLLCLGPELYTGFIRLQADRGLGRSFAGLLPFTEGLFKLGYISRECYEEHVKKYSQPLVKPKPKSPEQLAEERKLQELEKQFAQVLEQWSTLSEKSQKHWLQRAQEYQEKLPKAKELLALGKGDGQ